MPQPSLKVVVLPDAGPENPFQYELVRYLRQQGMVVNVGKKYPLGSTFRALHQHQPDVIYYDWVHSFILGKSLFWSWIKSLIFVFEITYTRFFYRAKMVHTLHNLQNHARLWLGLEKVIYGFFLRNCSQIRVYSEETKKAAIERFGLKPERIKVIQDLPYHFYYENKIGRKESRKRLNLNENDFVYLFFGELKPYKGIDNLLKAYAEIAQPNDRLIIAGKSYDAAYFASIKQQADTIPSVTIFHRFIEDEEVQVFFNSADVIVLPFVRIDHSGSVDLAMSFGKPVITLKTEAMMTLLGHQSELLFNTPKQLKHRLYNAIKIDCEAVGQQNFNIVDSTNYRDILNLFEL
ncbi:glycosyltransferase family 4 protein [Runella sp.]|uniref:glycosyltransferase family 4 protein n=1 Tax=Runella sp. TaxID=1960881 RepID=UPI0026242D43|nr:glycosyltransferase family 4 protein [Runella sp.]